MKQRDPLAELEAWRFADKSHCCQIVVDDGYGVSCWVVYLFWADGECSATEQIEDDGGLGLTILAALDEYEARK